MSLKLKKTGLKGILFNTPQPMVLEFLTTSSNESIQIPLAGSVDVKIDWGDGTIESTTSTYPEHEYETAGTYIVRVTGSADTLGGTSSPSALWTDTIQGVYSFGALGLNSLFRSFQNVTSNVKTPYNIPSSITNLGFVFFNASSFNQEIDSWNTSNVTTMSHMFYGASSFNQPIGSWDTSKVTHMDLMFVNASSFNQDISSWDTANVYDINDMFKGAASFNQPIGFWNISKNIDLNDMFKDAVAFNQDLSSWDTSNVNNMNAMFQNADSFDQDISDWDFSGLNSNNDLDNFMSSAPGLSSTNYDKLLIAWSNAADANTIFSPLNPNMGGSKYYSDEAQNARNNLIDNYGWTITDGGFDLDRINAILVETGNPLVTEDNQYIEVET